MRIGSITLISRQKVLKTLNKQGSKQHFLSTNQDFHGSVCEESMAYSKHGLRAVLLESLPLGTI